MDQSLPYPLKSYIEREHKSIVNGNQADHKPTFQSELDASTEACTRYYYRGIELMKEIGEVDLAATLRVYNLRHEYGAHDLILHCVCKLWVLVPRYVTLVEEMRELRKALV